MIFGVAPFTLTGSASSLLTVAYTSNTASVCSVQNATVTILGAGPCSITATQPGNANYTSAPSVTQSFTVNQAPQTITFAPLPSVPFAPNPLSLTATATSTLSVEFSSSTQSVCIKSGAALIFVGLGTCTITASQPGNANYLAATSVPQSFTIVQGPQTISFGALSNLTFGAVPFSLTATASSGLPVTLASTTSSVCTLSSATLTIVGTGTCSITASQGGTSNYSGATSVIRTFTVTQGTQTITFPVLSDIPFDPRAIALTATASSGLTLGLVSTTQSICTVSGTSLTLVKVGTCSITASQSGTPNYAAATSVIRSFNITQASQTITFPVLSNIPFDLAPITLTATASSGLTLGLASTTQSICTVSGTSLTLVTLGTCSITATQPGDPNYTAASSVGRSFTIAQGVNTITFATPGAVTSPGSPFALTATASSGLTVTFASTTTAICTVSGVTLIPVTSGTCSVTASQAGNTNYATATPVTRPFTINLVASSGGSGSVGGGGGGGGGGSPLTLSPTSVTIDAAFGGSSGTQTVTLSYPTFVQGAPAFSTNLNTNQGQGWLSVSPSSGTMTLASTSGLLFTYSATLTISGDPTGIAADSAYTGTINISAAGGIVSLPVTMNVAAQAAKFTVVRQSLSFSYQQNNPTLPATQSISVFSVPAGATYTATASSTGNWLSVGTGGKTPGAVSVSVDVSKLQPGTFSGSVSIASGTSVNISVPVNLTVLKATPPLLSVSPTLENIAGASLSQVTVSNAGGGTLQFTASGDQPWLAVSRGGRFRDAGLAGTSRIFHRSHVAGAWRLHGTYNSERQKLACAVDCYRRPDSPANTLPVDPGFEDGRHSDIDRGRSGPASPNGNCLEPWYRHADMDNPDIHHLGRQLAYGDQLRKFHFDLCKYDRFSGRPILRLGKCCFCECLEQPAIHFCCAECRRRTVGAGSVGVDWRSHFGRHSWKRSRGIAVGDPVQRFIDRYHLCCKCIYLWRCRMAFGKPGERHSKRWCDCDPGGRGLQRSLGRSAIGDGNSGLRRRELSCGPGPSSGTRASWRYTHRSPATGVRGGVPVRQSQLPDSDLPPTGKPVNGAGFSGNNNTGTNH